MLIDHQFGIIENLQMSPIPQTSNWSCTWQSLDYQFRRPWVFRIKNGQNPSSNFHMISFHSIHIKNYRHALTKPKKTNFTWQLTLHIFRTNVSDISVTPWGRKSYNARNFEQIQFFGFRCGYNQSYIHQVL